MGLTWARLNAVRENLVRGSAVITRGTPLNALPSVSVLGVGWGENVMLVLSDNLDGAEKLLNKILC